MVVIRSTLFTLGVVLWTLLLGVGAAFTLPFPRPVAYAYARLWARGVLWMLRVLVGLRHRVRGRERQPSPPVIYALKHQSAWETIAFLELAPPFAVVLKRELLRIPIYGWYLLKVGMVPIDRAARGAAMRAMLKAARGHVAAGRSIVIMPEGTRIAPGRTGRYHPGVAALYRHLDLPVVPVALNSGLFWARRAFLKRPGVITLEFLEPIRPGLDRQAFMALLEERIETATERLRQEAMGEAAPGETPEAA
jgi:1-acyl-sn-glycerol-3-phosphate acyltransferase